ncbi:uncharacterized protein VTP21DRAFT_7191 [Calcarisporiella thermophila]|uniref:uncharacterized protein n=1 Tax=Calcarisporiella thermophila TaxID=911321 RepID=UPI00374434B7
MTVEEEEKAQGRLGWISNPPHPQPVALAFCIQGLHESTCIRQLRDVTRLMVGIRGGNSRLHFQQILLRRVCPKIVQATPPEPSTAHYTISDRETCSLHGLKSHYLPSELANGENAGAFMLAFIPPRLVENSWHINRTCRGAWESAGQADRGADKRELQRNMAGRFHLSRRQPDKLGLIRPDKR